jgi:hypothetical protein
MPKFNGLSEEVRSVIRDSNPEQYKAMTNSNGSSGEKKFTSQQESRKERPVKHVSGTITGRRY